MVYANFVTADGAFQFTPPRRGRREALRFLMFLVIFQFTPPRRGRPAHPFPCRVGGDFNSRPRAGGDGGSGRVGHVVGISIHAPAQGATKHHCELRNQQYYFNSHPRAGGDRKTAQRRLAVFVQKSKKLKANLMLRLLQDAKTTGNYTNSTNCPLRALAAFCADLPGFSVPQRSAQRSQQ